MDKNFLQRKSAVYQMGLLFNQQPTDERITAYANALMKYEPNQIIYAFKKVIGSGSAFFPSLSEILAHLTPASENSDDKANRIASEIIQRVIDYGSYRLREAYDALSDEAKVTIAESSYILNEIANSDRDNLPTIRAQIRGLVKANSESAKNHVKNKQLENIGIVSPKLAHEQMRKLEYSTEKNNG